MLICKMGTQRVYLHWTTCNFPHISSFASVKPTGTWVEALGFILSPHSHSHLLHYNDSGSRSTSTNTQAVGTEAILNREPSSGEPGSHINLSLSSSCAAAFCLPRLAEKSLPHRIQYSNVIQNPDVINQSTSSSHRSDPDVSMILSQDAACLSAITKHMHGALTLHTGSARQALSDTAAYPTLHFIQDSQGFPWQESQPPTLHHCAHSLPLPSVPDDVLHFTLASPASTSEAFNWRWDARSSPC